MYDISYWFRNWQQGHTESLLEVIFRLSTYKRPQLTLIEMITMMTMATKKKYQNASALCSFKSGTWSNFFLSCKLPANAKDGSPWSHALDWADTKDLASNNNRNNDNNDTGEMPLVALWEGSTKKKKKDIDNDKRMQRLVGKTPISQSCSQLYSFTLALQKKLSQNFKVSRFTKIFW